MKDGRSRFKHLFRTLNLSFEIAISAKKIFFWIVILQRKMDATARFHRCQTIQVEKKHR